MLTKKPIKKLLLKNTPRMMISFVWLIFLIPLLRYITRPSSVEDPKLNILIDAEESNKDILLLSEYLNNQDISRNHLSEKDRSLYLAQSFVDLIIHSSGDTITIKSAPKSNAIFLKNKLNKLLNYYHYYGDKTKALEMIKIDPEIVIANNHPINVGSYFSSFLLFQLSSIVFGLIVIYMNFKDADKLRRIQVSGVPLKKINLEILIQEVVYILFWVIMILGIYSLVAKPSWLEIIKTFFNYLIFSISILSLVNLLSIFTKNERQAYGLIPIITLLSSFASGMFIPRFLLPNFVSTLGKLTPFYYAVDANLESSFSPKYFISLAIMLAISILFYTISSKKKYFKN